MYCRRQNVSISDSLTLASNLAITLQIAPLASTSSEANGKVLNKPSKKEKSATCRFLVNNQLYANVMGLKSN